MRETPFPWTSIINTFDPSAPLLGKKWDQCYVSFGIEKRITLALNPERNPTKIILVGQRGSGKTSTLARVARNVASQYMVVWIDLSASLDLYHFTVLDLLLSIAGGVYKVGRTNGVQISSAAWEEMVSSLSTLVAEQKNKPDFHLDPDQMLQLMACVSGEPEKPFDKPDIPTQKQSFGLPSELESLYTGPILREMLARTNSIIAEIRKGSGKEVFVILDGLDKMGEGESADVFQKTRVIEEIDCRLLMTLNHTAYYVEGGFNLLTTFEKFDQPNTVIYPRRKRTEKSEDGYRILREVVQRRLAVLGVKTEDVINSDALDKLISASGGFLRHFIRLVKNAFVEAEITQSNRVGKVEVDVAISTELQSMLTALGPEDREFLRNFSKSGGIWKKENSHSLLIAIRNNWIAIYPGKDEPWRDVHPILWDTLREKK
jgi:Cdc6-like AAA superfamily ATPase